MTIPEIYIYADILDQLEHNQVRYVVISGVAVVLHGYIRPVADLDIVIDRAPENIQCAMMALTASKFVSSIPLPLNMLTVLRMFDGLNREVDIFVRYHIPFDELFAAAEMMMVKDRLVRVASLEHVIQAKQITHRPHDLQDIDGLLGKTDSK